MKGNWYDNITPRLSAYCLLPTAFPITLCPPLPFSIISAICFFVFSSSYCNCILMVMEIWKWKMKMEVSLTFLLYLFFFPLINLKPLLLLYTKFKNQTSSMLLSKSILYERTRSYVGQLYFWFAKKVFFFLLFYPTFN